MLDVSAQQISPQLRVLWDALQAEAICVIVAGAKAFFPEPHQPVALLHACVMKQKAAAPAGDRASTGGASAGALAELTRALMASIAAKPRVSWLIVPAAGETPPAERLQSELPRALAPPLATVAEMQTSLRAWLLEEVQREASAAIAGAATGGAAEPPPPGGGASACLKLLASIAQETIARASLSSSYSQPENLALMSLAEALITRATATLSALPPPRTAPALAALQRQLGATFVGSLLPWLADALALFSAFAFDYAWRLLPLLLPLLTALRKLLEADRAAGRGLREAQPSAAEATEALTLQSPHPYKAAAPTDRKRSMLGGGKKKETELARRTEKHEWPGADLLTLKFDAKCNCEEGDWLTISFFKDGGSAAVKSLRLGGAWDNWPKAPITASADAIAFEWAHTQHSSNTQEHWGFGFTVVASKRSRAGREATPPMVQLQRSLTFLGAKCAALLVCGEPVTEEEKETSHRHWLSSPLFARGLPLQLPPTHALMHPFFGIKQSVADEKTRAETPEALFVDDLAAHSGGLGSLLGRYMKATTPELSQGGLSPRNSERRNRLSDAGRDNATRAEGALLAALLSYNGLLGEAQKAAALVKKHVHLIDLTAAPPPPTTESPMGTPRYSDPDPAESSFNPRMPFMGQSGYIRGLGDDERRTSELAAEAMAEELAGSPPSSPPASPPASPGGPPRARAAAVAAAVARRRRRRRRRRGGRRGAAGGAVDVRARGARRPRR